MAIARILFEFRARNPRRHVARRFHMSTRIAGAVHHQCGRLNGGENGASVDLPVHLLVGVDGGRARSGAHVTTNRFDVSGIRILAHTCPQVG